MNEKAEKRRSGLIPEVIIMAVFGTFYENLVNVSENQ
jgi:hypothetical protein